MNAAFTCVPSQRSIPHLCSMAEFLKGAAHEQIVETQGRESQEIFSVKRLQAVSTNDKYCLEYLGLVI